MDQVNAVISIDLDDDLGSLKTDVTAVVQILFNLIDNACKYVLPDKGGGCISLNAQGTTRGLIFEVSDEGKGITALSKPGVGLGLALCRRIFHAFRGELRLAKEGGKGASFFLTILYSWANSPRSTATTSATS